jgi:hypothetical protein
MDIASVQLLEGVIGSVIIVAFSYLYVTYVDKL